MRSRIVVFLVLAVAVALLGVYLGRSTNTPKAVGEPATTTPANASVGPTQRRGSDSGPARTPTASTRKAGPPNTDANPGSTATQPGHPPATKPPRSTGPVRFGKVTTTPSDATVITSIDPEHRALTTTFDSIEVGNEKPPKPDTTRSFSMTLPLIDGAKGETLRVHVQGNALAYGGAYAKLTLKLNGQGTVKGFPSGFMDGYLEVLEAPAIPGITYQLSGVLEVHQDPGTDATASLNVNTIDVSINR